MQVESFANNWAYLKVELNALERVILTAVARQKKENKEGERLLRTPADRAAQHWLQGLMNIDSNIGYDSPPPVRSASAPAQTYNQQLNSRLLATQQVGKLLALPALCDRLQLTHFEKNLVLLGIAPEVHRRYGKLYEYLNGNDRRLTIDLALRLLCRNDQEWRGARARLKDDAPLLSHNLVEILDHDDRPFLARSLKLTDSLVNYLLAEDTRPTDLDHLLRQTDGRSVLVELPTPLQIFSSRRFAGHLILAAGLREQLQLISHELKFGRQVEIDWGFAGWQGKTAPGELILCVGSTGTGKTAAAQAIAQTAGFPLQQLNLSHCQEDVLPLVCQELEQQPAPVLIVKNADRWFDRSPVTNQSLNAFLTLRQQSGCLTLLTVQRPPVLSQFWRDRIAQTLIFPKPNASQREDIWHRVFPPQVELDFGVDWLALAKYPLTGGEMATIARKAGTFAYAAGRTSISQADLEWAIGQHMGRIKTRS
jgi:ATPase family associated with various cellular activities (AAA)